MSVLVELAKRRDTRVGKHGVLQTRHDPKPVMRCVGTDRGLCGIVLWSDEEQAAQRCVDCHAEIMGEPRPCERREILMPLPDPTLWAYVEHDKDPWSWGPEAA